MLGSPILDVAIGMTFVFLTLSLIASAIQEIFASLVQTRSANLLNGIRSLLSGDTDLLCKLYSHGIIAGLYKNPTHDFAGAGTSKLTTLRRLLQPFLGISLIGVDDTQLGTIDPLLLPAYIPPRAFALAMIDILNKDHVSDNVMSAIVAQLTAKVNACEQEATKSQNQTAAGQQNQNAADQQNQNANSQQNQNADIQPNQNAAAQQNQNADSQQKKVDGQNKVQNCRAYEALRSLAIRAGNDVSTFQTGLEDWYSDAMDRVSGWYKKYTQNILLVIGLILAIGLNVDSIRVAKTLWFNQDARNGLVASASDYMKAHPAAVHDSTAISQPPQTNSSAPAATTTPPTNPPNFGDLKSRLNGTVQTFNDVSTANLLPVGWHHPYSHYRDYLRDYPGPASLWVLKASLGWILTAIALSLGAPFWFDLLNKFMVVRSTVKPQEKSQTDKTKDG